MTMIVSANLGDTLLIAADKRSMLFNTKTEEMQLHTNHEDKIRLWSLGAVAGSGETVFVNRLMDYFSNFDIKTTKLKQIDTIYREVKYRLREGINPNLLINNTLFFSIFTGSRSFLYSIPIHPFILNCNHTNDTGIQPLMHEIKSGEIDISCFNLPPDLSILKNFQHNLKPLADFENETAFLNYYISKLSQIFLAHATTDSSITTSFDLYVQNSYNGENLFIHVKNTF